jgi:hypothetical protein
MMVGDLGNYSNGVYRVLLVTIHSLISLHNWLLMLMQNNLNQLKSLLIRLHNTLLFP